MNQKLIDAINKFNSRFNDTPPGLDFDALKDSLLQILECITELEKRVQDLEQKSS